MNSILVIYFDSKGYLTLNNPSDMMYLQCNDRFEVDRLLFDEDNWLESKADILNDLDNDTAHPKENLLGAWVDAYFYSDKPTMDIKIVSK